MILLIRPILFAFLKSNSVKKLIVDLLMAAAKTTDNDVDDRLVATVSLALLKKG